MAVEGPSDPFVGYTIKTYCPQCAQFRRFTLEEDGRRCECGAFIRTLGNAGYRPPEWGDQFQSLSPGEAQDSGGES